MSVEEHPGSVCLVTRLLTRLAMFASAALVSSCALQSRNCPPPPPPAAHLEYRLVPWSHVPGWTTDELQQAWPAFLAGCAAVGRPVRWAAACRAGEELHPLATQDVRAFFEHYFDAYSMLERVGRRTLRDGLVTGYFEPLLHGDRAPSAQFNTPLYSPPPDLLTVELASLYPELKGKRVRARLEGNRVVPYYSRADLDHDAALEGHQIVWVDDPIDAFLLEVQGSGRVQLPDGQTIRLHYADENGQPYRSIGRYLIERGELTLAEATLPGIRAWALNHPARVQELLDADPSVVFFREEPLGDPAQGPTGALGVALTAGRSIAVDPAFVPLGAAVFLATTFPGSNLALQRLVFAQDTGGAIRGPLRADFFWGTGSQAAEQAGRTRQSGSEWLLWPKGEPLPKR
jgi:membrane-bound lytic murein transglycosylase A